LRETFGVPAYLGGKLYFGGWYEGGTSFERWRDAEYRHGVTVGGVLETRIGAVFLGGSLAEGGRRKLYFSLGRIF
jgi:NTE family protein